MLNYSKKTRFKPLISKIDNSIPKIVINIMNGTRSTKTISIKKSLENYTKET